ncbi:MAG: NAD-dependent malic enzyme [Atopobiaceae bacterium]|jgi:malate dehydrogenase (oxaloacetate-decarboxylating)|nr:NAD-dependent malic enzyme [Atopobiaceae bacterium]MCH4119409.1 NAD-dependent malic enzyme [Atopobiaceae bacterium]MCI1318125.1 NAD-dependent malic enzyme [Atopobiaceae bacterium]MCI1388996.1 NAD-dependent malic enzyme [Atopobiaceae bacterium]MCI1431770.1 NAD-dependent malic enzyme [Atopobiaceae bacterium]
MDFYAEALKLHEEHHGKISVSSKVPIETRDDLSVAYTPGVAEPCRKIHDDPTQAWRYTCKANTIAVVTNGTAVLGLGDIGPMAGLPVMEGKAVLFKRFGGVDAFPICLDARTPEEVIAATKAIAPGFGGINLEDIKSPDCFEIERVLERDLDIPVFHDDQHGTAIVVTAALLNALAVVGKRIEDVRIVHNGPGAAGNAIIKMMLAAGARHIIACDEFGSLYPGRDNMDPYKAELADLTNPEGYQGTLAEAMAGADVLVGTSKGNLVSQEMVRSMAERPIVFAMANPTPEISYEDARAAGAAVVGTGRSDNPNQINNLLCFPGLFKGALAVRSRDINDDMKVAAARAIAGCVPAEERGPESIIPSALDPKVAAAVAHAVAKAAIGSGSARDAAGISTLEDPSEGGLA